MSTVYTNYPTAGSGQYTNATYPSYPPTTSVTTTTSSTVIDPHAVQSVLNNLHSELRTVYDRVAGQERTIQELWGLVTFLSENPGKTVEDWRSYCQVKAKINETLEKETTHGHAANATPW